MTRVFILFALGSAFASYAPAQEDLQQQFVQRMSKALIELPSNPHEVERRLVASGVSAQDADQTAQSLICGLVRCLLENLRAYSEEQGESFSDKLPHMLESLDGDGAEPILKEMIVVSQALGPRGETCALNELQKAGIGVDMLE